MKTIRPDSNRPYWLFLITFSMVFYGTGATFVESFVNYPTWRYIGPNEFRTYHQAFSPLILGFMVIPLVVTTLLSIALLWFRPLPVPRWAIWSAVILQLITWVSTVAIQVPIQIQLSAEGLSLPLIDRLIFTNFWYRRLPHLVHTLLFLWMMSRILRANSENSISEAGIREPGEEI
jgi:hypothetical protein